MNRDDARDTAIQDLGDRLSWMGETCLCIDIFLTPKDEAGHSPAASWPAAFEQRRLEIRGPVLMVHWRVSRRHGVMKVVNRIRGFSLHLALPPSCRRRYLRRDFVFSDVG